MRRRDFLASVTLPAVGGACIPADLIFADVQAAQPGGADPATVFDSPPVLQNPAPDAMTVFVAVKTNSTAWVEFGLTAALGVRADASRHGLLPLNGRVHGVRITGLKPGTQYFYRVVAAPIDFRGAYKIRRGETVASATHSFTTLDDGKGASAAIAIINDTHENVAVLDAATKLLANPQRRADLLFWNGDVFNEVRDDGQIVANVLRPAGAAYAATTPMCFVSGNHDVRGIHARSLERFVETPGDRRCYVLRQGPVACVVLDTGEDKPDGHKGYAGLGAFERYRAEQSEWLESAIKQPAFKSAPFKVAVLHIPLFGKAASDDSRARWHELLQKADVDLAVHGHVHEWKVSPPDKERRYVQIVGGGPTIDAGPNVATVMHLEATRRKLVATVRDITGKELAAVPIERS